MTPVEPKFWQRLCELIDRSDLVERQYDADQESLAAELATVFGSRPLADWLELFEGEDVMAGPVATLPEAAEWLGETPIGGQGAGSRRAHRSVARSSSHPFEGWAPPQAEDDSRGG